MLDFFFYFYLFYIRYCNDNKRQSRLLLDSSRSDIFCIDDKSLTQSIIDCNRYNIMRENKQLNLIYWNKRKSIRDYSWAHWIYRQIQKSCRESFRKDLSFVETSKIIKIYLTNWTKETTNTKTIYNNWVLLQR